MRNQRTYSELFFSTAFETVNNRTLFTTDFVMYLTAKVIIKNPSLVGDVDKLFNIISLYYPENTMKKSSYFRITRKVFGIRNINENNKQMILYSENIQSLISRKKIDGKQKIKDELVQMTISHSFDDDFLVCIMAYDALETKYSIDYYGFLFFKLMQDFNLRSKSVMEGLSKINLSYKDLPIDNFISDATTKIILSCLGCVNADDLVQISPELLTKVNIICFENFMEELELLQDDIKSVIKSKASETISSIKERNKNIILYKYGFQDKKEHTLEETGTKFELTRERVRQIEARTIQILSEGMNVVNKNLKYMVDQLTEKKGFTTFEEVKSYLENDTITSYIIICLPLVKGINIIIDYNLQLIIYLGDHTLEEIEEAEMSVIGNIIKREVYNSMNEFQISLVNKNYNLKKGIYLRKGLNQTVVLDSIVRDVLPNGYHNGNIEDYETVIAEGKNKFGEEFDYSSEHALMAVLVRAGYILVDRGLYKHKELCADITTDLLTKIIDYVSSLPIVFYSAIYSNFEKELNVLGITNQYYLKGVLDEKLPEDMHTKRDYITGQKGLTSRTAILQKMDEYDSVFTFSDLRQAFPTTRDYIFNFVLYMHSEYLNLYKGRYVNYKLINLADDSILELKTEIDKALSMSTTSFVTDRKIYARLKFFNKELMSKLKFIENHFALFSLIQYLFKDEYYLKRPFISFEENEALSVETIYADYVSKLNEFDNNVIHNYGNKANMRGLYSYLEFMDMMSDEFVQVSMDKMVKKKCLNLSDETLQMIRSVVETAIVYSGQIDTRTFKGYGMFPKIIYPWNKYLLTGIVRTYFDEYSIENTENFVHKTDFIIKKIINR